MHVNTPYQILLNGLTFSAGLYVTSGQNRSIVIKTCILKSAMCLKNQINSSCNPYNFSTRNQRPCDLLCVLIISQWFKLIRFQSERALCMEDWVFFLRFKLCIGLVFNRWDESRIGEFEENGFQTRKKRIQYNDNF